MSLLICHNLSFCYSGGPALCTDVSFEINPRDRIGLIVFGHQAFVLSPLTYDRNAVRAQLEAVAPGVGRVAAASQKAQRRRRMRRPLQPDRSIGRMRGSPPLLACALPRRAVRILRRDPT